MKASYNQKCSYFLFASALGFFFLKKTPHLFSLHPSTASGRNPPSLDNNSKICKAVWPWKRSTPSWLFSVWSTQGLRVGRAPSPTASSWCGLADGNGAHREARGAQTTPSLCLYISWLEPLWSKEIEQASFLSPAGKPAETFSPYPVQHTQIEGLENMHG